MNSGVKAGLGSMLRTPLGKDKSGGRQREENIRDNRDNGDITRW